MKVQAAAGAGHHVLVQHANGKAVLVLQIGCQRLVAIATAQTGPVAQGLGGFLEVGEVIVVSVDGVADGFQHHTGAAGRGAGAGHAGGKIGGGCGHFPIGLEQAGQGLGGARLAVGQLVEFHAVELETGQDRVGSRLGEVGDQLPIALIGKAADIHVEGFGQGQQHPRGHRALIAFQQVEIAGRQAQRFGRLGLGHATFAPETAQAGAGEDLLESLVVAHVLYQNLQTDINTM